MMPFSALPVFAGKSSFLLMREGSKLPIYLLGAVCLWASFFQSRAQVVGYMPDFHPRYKDVATIPGAVLDIRDNEILYRDINDVVTSTNLSSHATAVYFTYVPSLGPAYITPSGAFAFGSPALQMDGQEQISLGDCSSGRADSADHIVDGRFGILHTPDGVFLRDFMDRTNCLISATAEFLDVAPNGNVVFTTPIDDTNKAIRWFHSGQTETINVVTCHEQPFVATDGTNILWSEPGKQQYPFFGSVYLQTPSEKITLATNTFLVKAPPDVLQPLPYSPVLMKNGWTIFPRFEPGNTVSYNNLYRRAPDGTISQITSVGAMGLTMRDDGAALVWAAGNAVDSASASGLYYVSPTGDQKFISPLFERYFCAGDKFYAYGMTTAVDGAHIYELQIEQDPFGIVYPSYNADTQVFSFGLIAGATGDYELQRTTDFAAWTAIATISVNSDMVHSGTWVDVTNAPGSFRLRKL